MDAKIPFQDAKKYLLLSLFFAGLGLCFGITAQAGSFYLFMVSGPAFLVMRRLHYAPPIMLIKQTGWLLILAYAVFPLTSIAAYLFSDVSDLIPGLMIPSGFKTAKLFASRFSSAVLVSGVLMLVIAHWKPKTKLPPAPAFEPGLKMDFFSRGLMLGLCAVMLFALVQHFLGFDYRLPDFQIGTGDLMNDGRYRAQGFYGHPLTLSTVALGVFVYYYAQVLNLTEYYHHLPRKTFWRFFFGVAIAICVSALTLIFVSGSKMALAIAGLVFLILPLCFSGRSKLKLRNLLVLWTSGVAFLAAATYVSGAYQRFLEVVNPLDADRFFGDRLIFWRVHWQMFLDRPILGQGYAFLDQFLRNDYYDKLGYASTPEKFNAHNLFLETLACAGSVGFTILIIIAVCLVVIFARASRKQWYTRVQYNASLCALAANLLHGLTQNTLFDSSVMYIYLTFLWLLIWNLAEETPAHA